MTPDEVRFLYAYDRWATQRVLDALDGLDDAIWQRPDAVGNRRLGDILVHQLGAAQRWRFGFQESSEDAHPEREPLPGIAELRERWIAEWAAVDAWLPTLTQGLIDHVEEGVPVWQMLLHVINHGTQHRAEAAALLTADGRSPGDLDMIDYSDERVAARAT